MSRYRALAALTTSPPPALSNPLVHPSVPIIYGADGFVAFCLVCGRRVTPGYWPRTTLQVAIADRIAHLRTHEETL